MKADLFYDARHELAEGPVWFDGCLWWVNIPAGELHKLDGPSHEVRKIDGLLGAAAPTSTRDRWVLATSKGFAFLDFTSGALTPIAHPEAEKPGNRFNDGKCDSRGRFWAGTMSMKDQPDAAAVYVLEPDLTWRKAFSPLTLSNGLAWSSDDSTMYLIDTPTRSRAGGRSSTWRTRKSMAFPTA
jgi:sugar lactone lactonase YvrE